MLGAQDSVVDFELKNRGKVKTKKTVSKERTSSTNRGTGSGPKSL